MNGTLMFTIWAIIGIATVALGVYRIFIAAHQDDDLVHLAPGEESLIPRQQAMAHRIKIIDRWGEVLTVLTVALGLVLIGAFLYQAWNSPNPGPNNFYRMNSPR